MSSTASCTVKENWRHLPRSVRLWHWCTSVAKRILITKMHKFGQLILRKIIKILATRCQTSRLKCTKFDFGCAPDPARGAYSAPSDSLAGFKGPTSKGRDCEGGRGGRDKGGERKVSGKRGGREEKRRGICLLLNLGLATALLIRPTLPKNLAPTRVHNFVRTTLPKYVAGYRPAKRPTRLLCDSEQIVGY